ncbi:MAG: VOC family protein [Alphaproteobacteria bacterium]|jgi:catechol 2,3-dioxygenase-like lactoylglutathione lyase family enzyme|nr:VOC family protein [Alphaproteobacteria bacterium]
MKLGAFSISLGVKDLGASKAFYEALGFECFGGNEEHNYLIMKNGDTLVGLFQGMFEGAMLTFNPGWDQSAGEVDPFTDVREIKERAKAAGLEVTQEQGGDSGPGSFVVVDPDGYPVLIDQHR